MVHFDQHIVFPLGTQFYISMLTLVLFLLVVALVFVGIMIYQLSVAIRTQSETSGVDDHAQVRKMEGKQE